MSLDNWKGRVYFIAACQLKSITLTLRRQRFRAMAAEFWVEDLLPVVLLSLVCVLNDNSKLLARILRVGRSDFNLAFRHIEQHNFPYFLWNLPWWSIVYRILILQHLFELFLLLLQVSRYFVDNVRLPIWGKFFERQIVFLGCQI